MAPRPLGPINAGPSGRITRFQRKLEILVETYGITRLARDTGIVRQTIGEWRQGCSPSLENVQQLARGLRIPVCYFADDERRPRAYALGEKKRAESGPARQRRGASVAAETESSYNRKRGKRA